MDITRLETKRLILRQWQYTDFVPFAKLSGNKDVMKYFPNILSRKESNALAKKIMCFIADNGWGMWAVEIKSTHEFIDSVMAIVLYPLPEIISAAFTVSFVVPDFDPKIHRVLLFILTGFCSMNSAG